MKKRKMLVMILATLAFIVTICEKKPTDSAYAPTYIDASYWEEGVKDGSSQSDRKEEGSGLSSWTAENNLCPDGWPVPTHLEYEDLSYRSISKLYR